MGLFNWRLASFWLQILRAHLSLFVSVQNEDIQMYPTKVGPSLSALTFHEGRILSAGSFHLLEGFFSLLIPVTWNTH